METINIGDIIYFGKNISLSVDNNNYNESYPFKDFHSCYLKWKVLDRVNDTVTMLCLDCFEDDYGDTSLWKDSKLRQKLNSEFLDKYFTNNEKKIIILTECYEEKNGKYNIGNSGFTNDKVFIFSLKQFIKYKDQIFGDNIKVIDVDNEWLKERDGEDFDFDSIERLSNIKKSKEFWIRNPGSNDKRLTIGYYNDGYFGYSFFGDITKSVFRYRDDDTGIEGAIPRYSSHYVFPVIRVNMNAGYINERTFRTENGKKYLEI